MKERKIDEKTLSQFIGIGAKAAESFNAMGKNIVEISKYMEGFAENVVRVNNQFNEWIEKNRYIFENYDKIIKKIADECNIVEQKVVVTLSKYNWFISPSLPIDIIFKIIELDKNENNCNKKIDEIFVEYFCVNNYINLESMVNGWRNNCLFKDRMNIILDCVNTLKLVDGKNINETNVILPTLITQIEGVFTDYLISKNAIANTYKTKKTNFRNKNTQVLTSSLDAIAINVLLDVIFCGAYQGKPLNMPFGFNRHKILHGEDINYGKRENLMRAFMILDFLEGLK